MPAEPKRAYRPFEPAKRPGGKPDKKPAWRVLVHHKHRPLWEDLVDRIGLQSAQRVYDYLSQTPGLPPPIGSNTPMKGSQYAAKGGMSRVYHYEVSGAGRIDYRFNAEYQVGSKGDKHAIVQIISIDLSSH